MGALYGPLHGGANEAVVRMLARVGSRAAVPAFVEAVKARKETMFGFGHRVYKSRDPRANIIRAVADEVFAIAGRDPLIDVAMELERVALADEYFVKRKVGGFVGRWKGGARAARSSLPLQQANPRPERADAARFPI